ncbi:MAG: hypothetical protein J3K34DRAFT_525227 [Monoraphidium minutum]|nr:MAG: hypothetical protein J3K34DRAFT_525227 [Monoraphidium minutum]
MAHLPSPLSARVFAPYHPERSCCRPRCSASFAMQSGFAAGWGARHSRCRAHVGDSRNRASRNVAAAAHGATTTVVEYLLLLRARPGAPPEEAAAALDAAWSLQYMAPALMCASAGAVVRQLGGAGEAAAGGGAVGGGAAFTHAVHYRLAQRGALSALLRHPLHAALLRDVLAPLAGASGGGGGGGGSASASGGGGGIVHVAFEGRVASQLEALFRRGDEFAEGADVLLLLRPGAPGAAAQAGEFVSRLAALAETAGFGAVQASGGEAVPCGSGGDGSSGGGGGGDAPDSAGVGAAAWGGVSHALLARFPSCAAAAAFLASPPVAAAAAADARLPLHLAAALEVEVAPGEEDTQRVQAV